MYFKPNLIIGLPLVFFFKGLVYVYECFAYMCVFVLHACLVPVEFRRVQKLPGTELVDRKEGDLYFT